MNVPSEEDLISSLCSLIEVFDECPGSDMEVYYKRTAFIGFQKILSGRFDRIQFNNRKLHLKIKKRERINAWRWKSYWRNMVVTHKTHIIPASKSLKEVKNQKRRGIG